MGDEGSENFNKFMEYCSQAYTIIRENGNLLINLLMIMLSAGKTLLTWYTIHIIIIEIPDLADEQAIHYIKRQMQFESSSDKQAM